MQDKIWFALPREIMETQLSNIDLLVAMFPEPQELTLDTPTALLIERLRNWCSNEKLPPSGGIPPSLSLSLNLCIETNIPGSSNNDDRTIQLNISIPLQSEEAEPTEAPPLKITLRQPPYLSKSQTSALTSTIPDPSDIFSTIDHIKDSLPLYLAPAPPSTDSSNSSSRPRVDAPLLRVWFYFPSLSTRAKRLDLVVHAPSYGLTGFVLAGKPGLLCLEGTSPDIDAYMKFIKTESWGDIPSHQKKVSERFREVIDDDDDSDDDDGRAAKKTGNKGRVFEGMHEITDVLGERRGERANRGDMKALEAWLVERGLGEAFDKVIM